MSYTTSPKKKSDISLKSSRIITMSFDENTPSALHDFEHGTNWPVVYIINGGADNKLEAYVGETTDASIRASQHLQNDAKKKLTSISVIENKTFNKSVILDLEAFLIKYMAADGKFKLINGNGGLQNLNYYQRDEYISQFEEIWRKLKKLDLVEHDLLAIENSNLFKYSPYKSLTEEQSRVVNEILSQLTLDITSGTKSSFIVNGCAGTGKTIVGIYLMKMLVDLKEDIDLVDDEEQKVDENLKAALRDFKVGIVIPMDNLREAVKNVFSSIRGLNKNMVLSPHEVGKSDEDFDLLIVDEAHRLRRRQNLTQYQQFDLNNSKLGFGKDGTELMWILKKSKNQIFFYDANQSIKPTDVQKSDFDKLLSEDSTKEFKLTTQMRCKNGGEDYVKYISSIFSNIPPKDKVIFDDYDLKLFDNVDEMVNSIKKKDAEFGLCRNIAGYSWDWKTKKEKSFKKCLTDSEMKEIIDSGMYDIEIDGYKYIWNTSSVDWINSPNSINEIGCIHTTQGFDLNYAGIIIGNELKYDDKKQCLYVDKKSYKDKKGKASATDEELLDYLFNIYSTVCARGIMGTYIYACDEGLREYLKKYI